jgi:tryptophan synthase alpha chain
VSRIEETFTRLGNTGEKGLVVYLTAGDPNPRDFLSYLHGAADGGADVLEVGIPFSDPMADGPTIPRRRDDDGTRALPCVVFPEDP